MTELTSDDAKSIIDEMILVEKQLDEAEQSISKWMRYLNQFIE